MNDLILHRLRLIRDYISTPGNEDALMAKTAILEIVAEAMADIEEQILEDIRRNGT